MRIRPESPHMASWSPFRTSAVAGCYCLARVEALDLPLTLLYSRCLIAVAVVVVLCRLPFKEELRVWLKWEAVLIAISRTNKLIVASR